jgi:hypothetical protein
VFVAAKLLAASADASLEHSENADVVVTHALGSWGPLPSRITAV